MADYTVTTNADSGEGSLRQAIENANNSAGADTITFEIGASDTIILRNGPFDIEGSVTITGSGQTIDANNTFGIFNVGEQVSGVEMSGLVLTGSTGGVIDLASYAQVEVYGVTAYGNDRDLNIQGSAISVARGASLDLINSTITENNGGSGAVYNRLGYVSVLNSTISDNDNIGVFTVYGSNTSSTFINSVIANNGGGDIEGDANAIEFQGRNIVTSGSFDNTGVSNDDPMLGELQDNGGLLLTQGLESGSPAINGGINTFVQGLEFDARGEGFARIVNNRVDLGAYEALDSIIVTTADDLVDADDGVTSLREAVTAANADNGGAIISFDIADTATLTLANGELEFTGNSNTIVIQGGGQTIDGNHAGRVFSIGDDASVRMSDLTITNGNVEDGAGGGFRNSGYLGLSDIAVASNEAKEGGGIFNTGTLIIQGGRIEGNSANIGGGLYNYSSQGTPASLSITESKINDNQADSGGGVFNTGNTYINYTTIAGNAPKTNGGYGGGILNIRTSEDETFGNLVLISSTVSDNVGTMPGISTKDGSVHIINSTISGNSFRGDPQAYGIVYNRDGSIEATNSTFDNSVDDSFALLNAADGTFTLTNSLVSGSSPYISGDFEAFGNNWLQYGYNASVASITGGTYYTGDPRIGALADNGGPTYTHALLSSSGLIDSGVSQYALNADGAALSFDQRGSGYLRLVGSNVDIGSFEMQSLELEAPDPSPSFPHLGEGVAVPENEINGLAPQWLIGDDDEVILRYAGGIAENESAFGWYTIAREGVMQDVRLLDTNLGDTDVGEHYSLGRVPDGSAYGFFLLVDGNELNPEIREQGFHLNGNLSLVERDTGDPGGTRSDGPLKLVLEDGAGEIELEGLVFHAAAPSALNVGGAFQTLSGADEDGHLTFAFEDIARLPGQGDDDFNDAIFKFAALNDDQTSGLLNSYIA